MPVTIVETPGSSTANSFQSLDEYKAYIDVRLPALVWTQTADDDMLSRSLIIGARLLSVNFDWTGGISTSDQALPWPRTGMLDRFGRPIGPMVIPDDLKAAHAEFSLAAGAGDLFADNDAAKQGIKSIVAGSVEVEFQATSDSLEAIDILIRRLGPEFRYLSNAVPEAVRMYLVASWYRQAQIRRPFMFKVIGA